MCIRDRLIAVYRNTVIPVRVTIVAHGLWTANSLVIGKIEVVPKDGIMGPLIEVHQTHLAGVDPHSVRANPIMFHLEYLVPGTGYHPIMGLRRIRIAPNLSSWCL